MLKAKGFFIYHNMKVCAKCKIEKEFSEFYNSKIRMDGLNSNCKICEKEYRKSNVKEYIKEYNLEDAEEFKQYMLDNPIRRKQYYLENTKENTKENKDKINNRNKIRRDTNPLFKLSHNTRSLISKSTKNNGYTKKSKTYEILGCSFEDFKAHLENQFTEGMTWENQGLWHLDHIYPVSRATNEEHLIKLNHYTNFQPLWAIDNIKKGNKLDYQVVKKYC